MHFLFVLNPAVENEALLNSFMLKTLEAKNRLWSGFIGNHVTQCLLTFEQNNPVQYRLHIYTSTKTLQN